MILSRNLSCNTLKNTKFWFFVFLFSFLKGFLENFPSWHHMASWIDGIHPTRRMESWVAGYHSNSPYGELCSRISVQVAVWRVV